MRWMTLLAITAVLALAGCGGSDEKSTGNSSSKATSTPTATEAASSAGGGENAEARGRQERAEVRQVEPHGQGRQGHASTMANPSQIPHAVAIKGNGVDVDGKTIGNGETSTASADLKPGTYTFYCPVGNHRAGGHGGHAHRRTDAARAPPAPGSRRSARGPGARAPGAPGTRAGRAAARSAPCRVISVPPLGMRRGTRACGARGGTGPLSWTSTKRSLGHPLLDPRQPADRQPVQPQAVLDQRARRASRSAAA